MHQSLRLPGQTHAVLAPTGLDALLALPPGAYPRNPNLRIALTGGTVTQGQLDAAKDRISALLFNSLSATESHMIGYTPLDTPDDHRWHIPAKGQRGGDRRRGGPSRAHRRARPAAAHRLSARS